MKTYSFSTVRQQRGIATLLILVLVGIAISAAVFGSLRYIQGAQDQGTALHAQTQAQMKAWSGVDMLYQYFETLSTEGDVTWGDLQPVLDAARTNGTPLLTGNPTALISKIDEDEQRVFVTITGTSAANTRAQSTSSIEVVYHIGSTAGGGGGGDGEVVTVPPSVINFDRNLRMSGSITVNVTAGDSYEVNVNGVVETGGNSINGVDTIRATDSIQIGSGSTYKNLFSNGDIAITGSVTVSTSMQALGNICLTGGTASGVSKANGFVYGTGSAGFGQIEARGASTYTGSNPKCNSYARVDGSGSTFGVWLAGNNVAGTVKTSASVAHNSGIISSLLAQKDLHITNGGSRVTSGIIGGVMKRCNASNLNNCSGSIPGTVVVSTVAGTTVPLSELQPITIESTSFDAYEHEGSANYVFKYVGGNIEVTVKNVEGIDNGTYRLMTFRPASTTYYDYLCKEVSGTTCLDAPESRKTICKTTTALIGGVAGRYANGNICILYSAGKWTVGGSGTDPSLAQGIAWFEGNLEIRSGTFYNTFIATGHILTSGNHRTVAPNFAGPNGGGTYSGLTLKGICSNAFFPHYPTQICTGFTNNAPVVLANYAYMAGSVVNGNYVGGDIDLGSSTLAFGSALAGNEFGSSGSTTIYGYITALGRAVESIDGNRLGNSTTIVVTQLPATYTPQGGGSGTGTGTGDGEGAGEGITVQVLWTRYL